MYTLKIQIDRLPKSNNIKLRSHFFKNHQENKKWDRIIAGLCAAKKPPAPLERARITIVRHNFKMLDFDNFVGSLKPVVDALVDAQVIADDSWKHIGAWSVDQIFRPKKDGQLLEITVEEL